MRASRYSGVPFVPVILFCSGLLQLLTLGFVGNRVSGGDAQTYIDLAADWMSWGQLLSADAFEGNFWPAGYSGFLAVTSIFGQSQLLAVRVIQIVMVLLLALMASDIASTVSRRASRWTLVVVAFSPTLIWGVWAIGYELLLGLCITASLWLLWRDRPAPGMSLLSGVIFGVALIVQFRAASVLPVLLFLAWKSSRSSAITWTIGVLVPTALWSARTFIATGSPVPWSSNGGYNLWNGNGPHATGHNVYPLPDIPEGAESQFSAALNWIISEPSLFMELVARKSLFLFYPTEIADISDRLPAEGLVSIAQWIYSLAVLLLLALFLGFVAWRDRGRLRSLMPVLGVALLFLIPNVFFIVEARFRIPVEALLLAVAAATASELLARWRHQTKTNQSLSESADTVEL